MRPSRSKDFTAEFSTLRKRRVTPFLLKYLRRLNEMIQKKKT